MRQIDKNTVKAKNQLKSSNVIFYENQSGKGIRVLFVGNSITLHGRKESIGWYGDDYGMAASCKEKDYVHLVMNHIREMDADAVLCIAQISDWEVDYAYGSKVLRDKYSEARDFNADIIIFRLVENCPSANYDSKLFYREYSALVDYFDPTGDAKKILTTGFWKHPADKEIMLVGKDKEVKTIYLGDLGEDEKMKAIGLFAHSGIANHPGDRGMQAIADRIISVL